ncbi:hypothetical protein CspHIS471_0301750 [Cutaneotrichosporon sp. HIS471]|nr:hypothetical protein CspHIS471_0301750 [Cutaneotrichosporon sp. HIS471]
MRFLLLFTLPLLALVAAEYHAPNHVVNAVPATTITAAPEVRTVHDPRIDRIRQAPENKLKKRQWWRYPITINHYMDYMPAILDKPTNMSVNEWRSSFSYNRYFAPNATGCLTNATITSLFIFPTPWTWGLPPNCPRTSTSTSTPTSTPTSTSTDTLCRRTETPEPTTTSINRAVLRNPRNQFNPKRQVQVELAERQFDDVSKNADPEDYRAGWKGIIDFTAPITPEEEPGPVPVEKCIFRPWALDNMIRKLGHTPKPPTCPEYMHLSEPL